MLTPLVLAVVLSADPLEEPPQQQQLGAVTAPAALPQGALALYGLVGAPDVGAGYRQGFGPFEIEARALFNIFEISGLGEVGARFPMLRKERLALAVGGGVGIKFDSGSRYFDTANFAYIGLRFRGSAWGTYRFSDLVEGVAQLDVPYALPLGVSGVQFSPTIGVGAEIHVGSALSLLASVHLGFDVTKEPLGVPQVRPAWAIRLGVGYRVF